MKRVLLSLLAVGLSINLSFAQNNYQSIADGDWTDPSIWQNGPVGTYPGENDNVTLQDSVYYDIINDTTTYGQITIQNGGGSLTLPGDALISNHTVFGTNSSVTLGGPLNLGSNTIFLIAGDLTVNSGSGISFTDKSSILRVNSPSATVSINDNISIQNGIFALVANGNTSFTINGGSTFTAGMNSAFYVEGSSANFQINGDLIFQNGSELVANLNANTQVTINGGASLVFKYGSSFFQGEDTKKISITGNQPIWEVELTNKAEWRHLSSPFASGFAISDLTGTDLNPNVTSGQENMYWWDGTALSAGDPAPGWQKVTNTSTAFEAGGVPINIYTGGTNYPFSNGGLISIQNAVAYASSYDYTIYNSVDPGTSSASDGDQGWNMIGNPYPTWLNLDTLLKQEMDGEYQGAHMWDADAGQYQAYVVGGETIERTHDNTGSSVDSISNKYIRPFQAFWVKMESTNASTTVTIDHEYRAISPAAAPPSYFSSAFIPRLRLNAYAASDSAWDQVLITMNPNSSKLRLGNEDAFDRASANDRPNMALIHEDGERLCIDSRPLDSTTVFPLVFEQGVDAATYYISMVDDQFDASMSAYLEDLKTNTLHDLENGAYSFTHDKSYATNRFNIHLAPSFVSQSELKLAKNNFQIWTANDKLFIQLDKAGINQNLTIEVYDLSGKLVFGTSTSAENTNTSIPLQLSAGAHIIKVNHPQYGSQVLKTIR